MCRLFHANFDFEYQLRSGVKLPPAVVRRRNAEFSLLWVVLADSEDWLEVPSDLEPGFFERLAEFGLSRPHCLKPDEPILRPVQLCPWGWTSAAVATASRRNVAVDVPPLDIVRTVNSRRFSMALEAEWNIGLAESALITSEADLKTVLQRLPADITSWLLKAEFGMAGRERFSGEGNHLADATARWVRKRLRNQEAVIFEPRVDIIAETGLQLTVPKTGPPVLEGITPLLTDRSGTYRGSRFDNDPALQTEWAEAVAVAMRAAERIQSLGYFGPLGIDAAQYQSSDGIVRLRALQDINARFTMGRLSLGLRRLLKPGETGDWLHQPWPTDSPKAAADWFARFCDSLPVACRAIRTSPFHLAGQPVAQGTVAVIRAGL